MFSSNGAFTYTPNSNYIGKDTFKYKICDGDVINSDCDTATMFITIDSLKSFDTTVAQCVNYTWSRNAKTYTISGNYIDTVRNKNNTADSCYYVLHLTINHGTHNVGNVSIRYSYFWHGINYTTSGNYVYTYINEFGCPSYDSLYLNLTNNLNVKLFLEGLYLGNHRMIAALNNPDIGPISSDSTATDTITINLWSSDRLNIQTPDYSVKAILHTNGMASISIPESILGGHYYIVIKNRNSIETWSATPYNFGTTSVYCDFTSSLSKAYDDGSNPPMKYMGNGVYAIYGGDVNQDGTIDGFDIQQAANDASEFAYGYNVTDCNGDGASDGYDIMLLDNNSSLFLFYARPY